MALEEEQKDYQFGISQENIEELRAEFISLGGMVTELPEVGDVRDWTMVAIESTDSSGNITVNLFLMLLGKWFNLTEYLEDGVVVEEEVATVTEIKSGLTAGTSSAWTTVTFATAFESTPNVVFTLDQGGTPEDLKQVYVKNVATTGFEFWYKEKNALGLSAHWIATSAGDA